MSGLRSLASAFPLLASALCGACSSSFDVCGAAYCLHIGVAQHATGVGAAQGLDVRDGLIWIIGDGGTGIARPFVLDTDDTLSEAGDPIALTVGGKDQVPHPTGLTYQPGAGTFLGDTVSQKGEILALDWYTATANGTLDGAILHAVPDDAAHNGSRPELVWVNGRWLIATADYGKRDNELRFYDPDLLLTATDTTDPGVVVMRFPSPPFVQSLHYWEARDVLVLVQNRRDGSGWKLTLVDLASTIDSGALVVLDVLEPGVPGELEGFHFVDDERALMVTSSHQNAYVAKLTDRP